MTNADKEHIANLLRRDVSPSVVMAEVRLREVVNGSPGSIVQVRRDDLRELLLEYRRVTDAPRRWHRGDCPEIWGYGCACGGIDAPT